MKRQISTLIIAVVLSTFSTGCFAQEEQETFATVTPKWISEKGYWTIESNIKTPENSIIYFYNNENVLVYKEKVVGMKINLKKRKVLMHLKNVLEQSVTAWEEKHILKENGTRVAIALKK